jgi:hypothetical protein
MTDDAMDMRSSMKNYPRRDSMYKKKDSLNFDMMRTKIFLDRKENKYEGAMIWIANLLCGVILGFICFMLVWAEDRIIEWRIELMQHLIIHHDN